MSEENKKYYLITVMHSEERFKGEMKTFVSMIAINKTPISFLLENRDLQLLNCLEISATEYFSIENKYNNDGRLYSLIYKDVDN